MALEVEWMPEASREMQEACRIAIQKHIAAISQKCQALQLNEQTGKTLESTALSNDTE